MAEFPDFGRHCSFPDCQQLDFLPVICDACKEPFCVNHFRYTVHSCSKAINKDRQVPVCPVCMKPVPISNGHNPDEVINAHLDKNCAPSTKKRSFPCELKGCKKREFIEVTCPDCKHNFCLSHRYQNCHSCTGKRPNDNLKKRVTPIVSKANTTDDEELARTIQALWNKNQEGLSDEELARQLQAEENNRAQYQAPPVVSRNGGRQRVTPYRGNNATSSNSNCSVN